MSEGTILVWGCNMFEFFFLMFFVYLIVFCVVQIKRGY